ncbi:MAG: sigma-70 family RNA polymerase sigma factor [Polyangiaceae bacterium]
MSGSRDDTAGADQVAPREDPPDVRARIEVALALVPAIVEQLRAMLFARARRDDLTSYANEGALTAARTYDAGFGVPFNRWASLRIRGSIVDGLRADAELPRRLHERLRALAAASSAHEGCVLDDAGSPVDNAAGADAKIGDRLAAMATAYAAGVLMARDDETLESIRDLRGTPEEELSRAQLKAAVRAAIAERPEAERVLLERYYFDGATLTEASGGLSRSWSSRLHARAIEGVSKTLARARITSSRDS